MSGARRVAGEHARAGRGRPRSCPSSCVHVAHEVMEVAAPLGAQRQTVVEQVHQPGLAAAHRPPQIQPRAPPAARPRRHDPAAAASRPGSGCSSRRLRTASSASIAALWARSALKWRASSSRAYSACKSGEEGCSIAQWRAPPGQAGAPRAPPAPQRARRGRVAQLRGALRPIGRVSSSALLRCERAPSGSGQGGSTCDLDAPGPRPETVRGQAVRGCRGWQSVPPADRARAAAAKAPIWKSPQPDLGAEGALGKEHQRLARAAPGAAAGVRRARRAARSRRSTNSAPMRRSSVPASGTEDISRLITKLKRGRQHRMQHHAVEIAGMIGDHDAGQSAAYPGPGSGRACRRGRSASRAEPRASRTAGAQRRQDQQQPQREQGDQQKLQPGVEAVEHTPRRQRRDRVGRPGVRARRRFAGRARITHDSCM